MISYAQNFEDVLLARVFRDRRSGFYIDIGAMDPVADSVTKYFYDAGWHGINVEPVDEHYDALVQERQRDVNVRAAISDRAGEAEFFYIPQTGLSSLQSGALDQANPLHARPQRIPVQTLTLAQLCKQHVDGPIDFLKVDVEGTEFEVLRGGDWLSYRPTIIIIEAVKPNTQIATHDAWEPILTTNGYVFATFDGLNRFYVEEHSQHLIETIRLPPNYFDNFVQWRTVRAEREVCQLHAELERKVGELRVVEAARQTAIEVHRGAERENQELLGRVKAVHQELEQRSELMQTVHQELEQRAELYTELWIEAQRLREQVKTSQEANASLLARLATAQHELEHKPSELEAADAARVAALAALAEAQRDLQRTTERAEGHH